MVLIQSPSICRALTVRTKLGQEEGFLVTSEELTCVSHGRLGVMGVLRKGREGAAEEELRNRV